MQVAENHIPGKAGELPGAGRRVRAHARRGGTAKAGTAQAGSPAGRRAAGTRHRLEDSSEDSAGRKTAAAERSTQTAPGFRAEMMGLNMVVDLTAGRARVGREEDTAAQEAPEHRGRPWRAAHCYHGDLNCKWEIEQTENHNQNLGFENCNLQDLRVAEVSGSVVM